MNFVVFAYDFPHWKTQMGLLALYVRGFKPAAVIAAPWKKLNVQYSLKRVTHRGLYLKEPQALCDAFGFDYIRADHNVIEDTDWDFAVILGARILRPFTVRAFKHGVINFHPGMLPDNRGLDNVKWAVKLMIPQGVTAHWINEKVDAGKLISRQAVPVYHDDTLLDVQFRVQNAEIAMLELVVGDVLAGKALQNRCPPLDESHPARKCLTKDEEETLDKEFDEYKRRFAVV